MNAASLQRSKQVQLNVTDVRILWVFKKILAIFTSLAEINVLPSTA